MPVDRATAVPGLPHALDLKLPSPVEELKDERIARHDVRLFVKRDDLIHPELPGNKWRKLKYNLDAAAAGGYSTLLTFGGAYSNHIRAVAAAGHYFGYSTIGIIRGEEHRPLNPTLAYATERGMQLTYMDRQAYREKHSSARIDDLRRRLGDFYLIPEGGSNAHAVRGAMELPTEITAEYDTICCPCGTGGTLAGIAAGLPPGRRAVGFSALKGGGFLVDDVRRLQREAGVSTTNWSLELDYHFGGFARRPAALDEFIADVRVKYGIELEWVYVAKMLYGVFAMIERGAFAPGESIVAVLTGPVTP